MCDTGVISYMPQIEITMFSQKKSQCILTTPNYNKLPRQDSLTTRIHRIGCPRSGN